MNAYDPLNPFGVGMPVEPPDVAADGGDASDWWADEPANSAASTPAETDASSREAPADPAAEPPELAHGNQGAWARWYAALGYAVFPLVPGDKVPFVEAVRDGRAERHATTDAATVERWWTAEPRANIGVVGCSTGCILDVDAAKGGYETLAALERAHGALPATPMVVRTPGTGEHRYFRAHPAVASKTDALGSGLDTRGAGGYVVGVGSYFADPGGKKGYTGFYTLMSAAPASACPEAPQWLVLMAGEAKQRDRDQAPVAEQDAPADIERARQYLVHDAPAAIEGQGGNNTTFKVACQLRDIGLTEGSALDAMRDLYNPRCVPPWDDADLATICANAFAYAQNAPGVKSAAALASGFGDAVTIEAPAPASAQPAASVEAAVEAVWDEASFARLLALSPLLSRLIMAGQPRPAVPWLAKKTLPRRGVGVLYGPSTAGKSYLVLDLAAKLWRGEAWFGAKVAERKATVILAFEGADFMGYRLDALRAAHAGENPAILVIEAGRMDAKGLRSIVPQLRGAAKLCQARFGLDVGLVVIDTVSAAGLAQDEDKANDVSDAIKTTADVAAAVGAFGLLVHHPNKQGSLRGSGAWFNNTDVVIRVEPEGEGGVRKVEAEKVKDGPARTLGHFVLEEVKLGKDEDGEPTTACVVTPSGKPTPRATGGPKHFDRFIDAFEEAARARGTYQDGRPFAPIADVEDRFNETVTGLGSAGARRMAWSRCKKHAEAAGMMTPVRGERHSYALTDAAYAVESPQDAAADFGDAKPL